MNIKKFNINIANIFFFLIFWGYVLYSFLLYLFDFKAFLGGYFGIVTTMVFLIYLATSFFNFKFLISSARLYAIFSFICFSIVFLNVLIAFLFYENLYYAAMQSTQIIVFGFGLFILGFYFVLSDKTKILKLSVFFISLIFLYCIYYYFKENKLMLPFGTSQIENEDISGYQGLARNIFVIGVLVLSLIQHKLINFLFSIIFLVVLFFIGSRSEFLALLLVFLVFNIIFCFKKISNILYFLPLLACIIFYVLKNFDSLSESRQFNVFSLSKDDSWIERKQIESFALKQINENPILGDFGGHIRFHQNNIESVGAYSHNALSGYANFGILFFILFMVLCIIPVLRSLYELYKGDIDDKDWKFLLGLSIGVLFLIVFTKPVFWPITYLMWGVYIGTLHAKSKVERFKKI